ncbi:MAG: PD40 domain-containing protein [Chloroflexi bacterium]|nr:PD40 domain-containing protein [Chloroflexota bacterium]
MRLAYGFILAAAVALLAGACGGSRQQEGTPAPPTGRIAFSSDRDGYSQVYVMNADGSGQVNVSQGEDREDQPWWAPDGEHIAFSSLRDVFPDIYLVKADGTDLRRLTNDAAVDGAMRWSPDGSKVAFYSFQSQSRGFLWVAKSDMTDQTPVLASLFPAGPEVECAGGFPGAWFPDGNRILYRGSGSSGALQICAVNEDGSDVRIIHSEPQAASYYPALSPDGTKIAFTTNRDGNDEIYVMNADGSDLQRVTDSDSGDTNPTWSPDGNWIAFSSNRDGQFAIYIVQADGTGLFKITDNKANDSQPAWSPR